ncbi:hypothetical protein D6C97_03913 [Aureobasidium pullulans]|nr:hypothetical protein D6D25_01863 [Aureobasidium pullulans]THY59979.1 hypothetical protein D6C97_03913 [Aureobasidium pullulans]
MRTAFFVSALASTAFAGVVTQISDGQIQAPTTETAPAVVASSAVESVSSVVASSVVASVSSAVESSVEVSPIATSSALSTRMPVPIVNATVTSGASLTTIPAAVVPSAGLSTVVAGGNSTGNATISSHSLKASSTVTSSTKGGASGTSAGSSASASASGNAASSFYQSNAGMFGAVVLGAMGYLAL